MQNRNQNEIIAALIQASNATTGGTEAEQDVRQLNLLLEIGNIRCGCGDC
jgi:hypothetical protein